MTADETPLSLSFTVDSALLKELGERLVGKAHIALAELIKNAYDADAHVCEVDVSSNTIEIRDDGHGMTLPEFTDFWMRVGTTHKQTEGRSRELGRPLTGSKGIGRLAVQFLGRHVRIETTAKGTDTRLVVTVDWDKAIRNKYLTQATAIYEVFPGAGTYADGKRHGFKVTLSGMLQEWDDKSLEALAQEVWTLRPPFDGYAGMAGKDGARDFDIRLSAEGVGGKEAFETQISAAVNTWIAKIEGAIQEGRKSNKQRISVTFREGDKYEDSFPIPDCQLNSATWEIRVFKLSGHLAANVKVGQARVYFSEFGGVHVYDGPFRLPYYGIEQDWLGIEFDHSHRKVRSRLLPDYYHVDRALNDLPTQGRILGVVRVNTGAEMRDAPRRTKLQNEFLKIQVTRDRLQANKAYDQLKDAVRRSIDYYAVCSMRRRLEEAKRKRPTETGKEALVRVQEVLGSHRDAIPEEIYGELKSELKQFVVTTQREQHYRDTLAALLGPLATAGISAIALDHETGRALTVLETIASRVAGLGGRNEAAGQIAEEIREWIRRFRHLRRVFEPLANAEDREQVRPLKASRVLKLVTSSISPFLNGVDVAIEIPDEMHLPAATLAEWQALFQNVITNSLNAMVDAHERKLRISAGKGPGRKRWIRVSDSGSGIDLDAAESLFEPFQRHSVISPQRKALGLGGLGLGLTIVRMISEGRNCKAAFVAPEPNFETTFELSWTLTTND